MNIEAILEGNTKIILIILGVLFVLLLMVFLGTGVFEGISLKGVI